MSTTIPVPTTPTSADKHEEVRKLNVEIANLTSVQDTAQRAATVAQEAAQEARTRSEALQTTIDALESSHATVAIDLRKFVEQCRTTLQMVLSVMETAAQSARNISHEVDRLTIEIQSKKKELDDLRDAFALENIQMSDKRLDLAIYEDRIRTAAAIHLPGQKVDLLPL